ncbi:tyrosine-type recombinase/integrase [Cupriavidus metallidurans]|uniref:tyrosine-type recombinase/integrase n=1 Tax=Cupriavidus metallidurans TaxID=119219 RepID=UPI0007639AC5|nr:integrase arm-type DNA-binding domain-containing protein [Cupriavidus metallidurans]KWW37657.1 hypothetical protein AU374_01424 [Cupriavidus metallidurans]
MPKLTKRLTDSLARKLPLPAEGYEIHWCADDPGFGCRVTAAGARAWIMERRVDGKTRRRTLGKASGAAAISSDAARRLKIDVSSELQQGTDRLEDKRAAAKQEKAEAVTLAAALKTYVEKKQRAKDGLALKERTKAHYLAMVRPGKIKRDGSPALDGWLYPLANKSIHKITAQDIRDVHAELQKRGKRLAAYAMQVLRAVLNWHGIKVPDNPLGLDVAGRDRIVIPGPKSDKRPIPLERLGAWWRAACDAGMGGEVGGGAEAAAYYRFKLLTGLRDGEGKGDKYSDGVRVRDVDFAGQRIRLPDTKNRQDHYLMLSRQAFEIVKQQAKGKKPTELLFPVGDPRKTLDAINKAAGTNIPPKGTRSTFASIADELVSSTTVKAMMNHLDGKNVTTTHYIFKDESTLRAGWQAVADFIESRAATDKAKGQEVAIDGT